MPSPSSGIGLPSLGSIASAGLSFFGDGLFGDDDADAIAWQNHLNREAAADAQRAAITAGQESRDLTQRLHASNLEFQDRWAQRSLTAQQDAAQKAIQWRVADAEKAGIHPMYALGMNPINISPVTVGGGGVGAPPPSETVLGAPGMVPTLRDRMGQNISRALTKMLTKEEKAEMANDRIYQRQQLRSNELDLQIKSAQLALLQKEQVGPPAPSDGTRVKSGASFQPQPAMPTISSQADKAREAGHITDYGYVRDRGGLRVVPSKDMKERMEDSLIEEGMWNLRNRVSPMLNGPKPPSSVEYPLPKGEVWRWNMWTQSFQPYNSRTGQYRRY